MEQGNKIILVLGILVIIAGLFVLLEAVSFQKRAVITEGKVVHVLGSSYKISYFLQDDTEKICQGSGKNHRYHEGDRIRVWYRIDKPERARLSDGKKGGRNLMVVGIACIFLGIYPLIFKKK